MWPFLFLAIHHIFPEGIISFIALLSFNVYYPILSWWLVLYIVGIILKELELLSITYIIIGKLAILFSVIFTLSSFVISLGIWRQFLYYIIPLTQLWGYGWLFAWCLTIFCIPLISVRLKLGLSMFFIGGIILLINNQIWILMFGLSTSLVLTLHLKEKMLRAREARSIWKEL